ncbi:hypothetical protein FSP39_020098 [Pinctada imbricata]|uniref:phenylalanine--tRNA ligase n=1 Tax=Pinctada imbricata TaxID=66713 RepID=A0AA88YGU4_PINIB|nr:hypothetical protein FSP39_020098 [Pinctada imbricata]
MPTVEVDKDELFQKLGKRYSFEEFDELCFEFGLEPEEADDEDIKANPELANQWKIEIGANRYDLLCIEGITRAILIFLEKSQAPRYKTVPPCTGKMQQLIIKPVTAQVRPHAVAAVLRNITFTPVLLLTLGHYSFQKQHFERIVPTQTGINRRRTLVAIGTHDLDTIQGPFIYDAQPPSDIKFQALSQKEEKTAVELMEIYSGESHLRQYLHIIQDKPVYPIIYDQNGVVLSMPPIINGDHSKISLKTRNVFIECTATDLNKAKIVLDTLVTMFSQYCDVPYQGIEPAEVIQPDGTRVIYPELPYRFEEIDVADVNGKVGINISGKEMARLLTKMCLVSETFDNDTKVKVEVPPTRHDILYSI